jgi:hypothetical protein
MWVALRYDAHLPDLPLTVPLTYLAAMGGFWGVVFVISAAGLLRARLWSRWLTLVAVTLYEINVWINHLLFDANDYARQTWPRGLVFALLLLAFVWGALNWPSIRKVFKR